MKEIIQHTHAQDYHHLKWKSVKTQLAQDGVQW